MRAYMLGALLLVACGDEFSTRALFGSPSLDAGSQLDGAEARFDGEAAAQDAVALDGDLQDVDGGAGGAPSAGGASMGGSSSGGALAAGGASTGGVAAGGASSGGALAAGGASIGGAAAGGGSSGGGSSSCVLYTGAVFVCSAPTPFTFYPCPVRPAGCVQAGQTAVVCCTTRMP
jgi:hypothetical protein